VQPVGPGSFRPPPAAEAAYLSVRPRPITRSRAGQDVLRALLRAGYRSPPVRLEVAAQDCAVRLRLAAHERGAVRRVLIAAEVDPALPARQLTAEQWHRAALALVRTASAGRPQRARRRQPAGRAPGRGRRR
jgi:16S rRNA A1518/A1519 N6-dimethyltransferase RsmA/KsgA/DIM1 with predicted DNA glycosylase/AP lyase activity